MVDVQDPQVRALITEVAEKASERTVQRTLQGLGVDVTQPLETQRDFAYLRQLRASSVEVGRKGLLTMVGLIIAAVLAALWTGIKANILGR